MNAPTWLGDAAKTLTVRAVEIIVLGLVVIGALSYAEHRSAAKLAAQTAQHRQELAALAKDLGATTADVVSTQKLAQGLRGQLAAANAKLSAAGARPEVHTSATANIADTAPGTTALPPPGVECPVLWSDSYHRFKVDLPSGLLTRRQMFTLETVVFRGVDGSQRFGKAEMREFDPETKAEIPNTGITLGLNVQVTDEKGPGASRWHLYGVAAVDHRTALGAGVQAEPLAHAVLTAAGLYSAKEKEGRALLGLGYRPGSWAIAFSGYGAYSTKLKFAFGLLGTIRVWGEAR